MRARLAAGAARGAVRARLQAEQGERAARRGTGPKDAGAGEAGGLRGRAAACWVVRVGLGRRGLARWVRMVGFGCWAEAKLRSGPKGKGGESGPQG